MALPTIFSLEHPVTQSIVIQGVQLLGQWWLKQKIEAHSKVDYTDRYIERIDALISKMSENNKSNSQPVKERTQKQEEKQEEKEQAQSSVTSVQSSTTQKANDNIAVACLPCTRAHLITIAGTLKEALRFAREEGLDHPEVLDRLDAAAEEIAVMERFDLSPEKIQNAPDKEKEVIRELLPKIRNIRQNIINNVKSPEDLEELSTQAVELYKRARVVGEPQIPWDKIKEGQEEKGSEEAVQQEKQPEQ